MHETPRHPGLTVPVQAPPVHRDQREASAARAADRGVEAAKSVCGDLVGTARQMCRAMQNG
ncbi:hypothetical protein ACHBTE_30560 [Streptomyces sp. M41]|uniref:hypothetical protein n=1 Tax=Streptomyces sp. M41 TaxID=3059412 RepID=UPI00374DDC25